MPGTALKGRGTVSRMKYACVLALLCLTTACKPLVIGRVGDSIMYLMGEELELEAARAGHTTVGLAVFPGISLSQHFNGFISDRLAQFHQVPVDVVVVSLLTNDAATQPLATVEPSWPLVDTDEELDAHIDKFMRAMPFVPVVWLVPGSPILDPAKCEHFRKGLQRAQARWPYQLTLLEQAPEWFDGGDGVHYGPAGETLAAKAVMAHIAGVFTPPLMESLEEKP